jgi:hypothetical protein
LHFSLRLKAGLKLQNISDKNEVEKGLYLLEQPTSNLLLLLFLLLSLLVTPDKIAQVQRERLARKKREKMHNLEMETE